MMHLDEFYDEHFAAKAEREADRLGLIAAREAGERLRRMEMDEAARAARAKRERPVWDAIAAEVNRPKWGQVHTAIKGRDGFWIDGVDVTYQVSFDEIWTKGYGSFGRGSKPSGRVRLVIRGIGKRKSFPPRKDGTYNYEAIASILIDIADTSNKRRRAEAQRRANTEAFTALRGRLGLKEYTSFIKPSSLPDKPVFIDYHISRAMSEEDAVKVYDFLKSMGMAPTY